jgi:hypothetical protein
LRKILRSLKHRISAWEKEEELKRVEFKYRPLIEEEVQLCEPEQGDILGEEDE